MKIGLLIGTALPEGIHPGNKPTITEFGMTSSGILEMEVEGCTFMIINRHGVPPTIPPHEVNNQANLKALHDRGCEAVLSICSCGSLREDIPVPSVAVPNDYIDLFSGATVIHGEIRHEKPGFDPELMEAVGKACGSAGIDPVNRGIYIQTKGPRFETAAEVRMLSIWGDFVGMNLGSEATISSELGLPIAGILTVDNYANGVGDLPDYEAIRSESSSKWRLLMKVLRNLAGILGK